jgi:PQQ-dependent dehydrogenase (methanol/ethanol family)
VRVNFNYFVDDEVFDYILEAVEFIADRGWEFLPDYALEADTGDEVWRVEHDGWITSAPRVVDGKVIIGNGGAEYDVRGYVSAYHPDTGDLEWRTYTVPGDPSEPFESPAMERAAETWTGEWWKHGGGGNTWHGYTYDAELDMLYIGTGNGSPWNRKIRSPGGGDNLFLSSIVALNPDNGEYIWHYQTVPGDTWDYNSNMDIVLADLTVNGEDLKTILHAPKNGFFYVINRKTGKLISAEPYVETTWASHIDMETGRPVEVEGSRYEDGGPVDITPSPYGSHSWHAMSYNPQTGLAYIPTIHNSYTFSDTVINL